MDREYLLAIDIGTTNTKAALFRTDGTAVAMEKRSHRISSPKEGWAEHDPETVWWKEVCEVCQALTQRPDIDPSDILAVAVSSLSPAMTPIDEEGISLRPAMLYGLDRRALGEMQELRSACGALNAAYGGEVVGPLSIGPKILWLQRSCPEVFRKTAHYVGCATYIVNRLTGKLVADYACNNIGGHPFSRACFSWDEELCRQIGITLDQLPELHFAEEKAGEVTAQAARQTGLCEGTPVSVGTGDFPAESLSFGSVLGEKIRLTLGTTVGVNFGTDHAQMIFRNYDWKHPKETTRGGAMSNGCSTVDWVIRLISGEGRERLSNEELLRLAGEAGPGAKGVLMLPYLNGESTPINNPYAKGMLFGLETRHGAAELYRASLEALAYSIRQFLERAPKERRKEAVVLGGGKNLPGLMQIISDVTGYELIPLASANGSLVGDAFIAGIVGGVFHEMREIDAWVRTEERILPDPENEAVYARGYALFRELYEANACRMSS